MKYTIGLIDEEPNQLITIGRTIKIHMEGTPHEIDFISYELEGRSETLVKDICQEVLNDILIGAISSLLVDYKIILKTAAMVEGTDIYKMIIERVPKFPVVILTQVPEECYMKDFVDADKIYRKKDFFKVDDQYSIEKTKNIFSNMDKYIRQRAEMDASLEDKLEKYISEGFSPELFQEILEYEQKLDAFYPSGQPQTSKALRLDELKKAVALLDQANRLIGGGNEA